MTREEWLLRDIDSNTEVRREWLTVLANNPTPDHLRWACDKLWYDHQNFALHAWFMESDPVKARQHFYTCGRLDEYAILHFDAKVLDYGINHLAYALLSDHQVLIQRYTRLRHSAWEEMVRSGGTAPHGPVAGPDPR
jgi:hypothetical protein